MTVITKRAVSYPARRTTPPQSWKKAAGILRGRRRLLEQHVRKVRSEWK